ncbi:MAG: minor capsid protein [Chloroflexi bacterium]|nr:minor capsid protein [Chloroflexota bacterium]
MKKALIVGVATGQNPRTVARMIRQELGGNLVRALTISRTEIVRSYRTASLRGYQANADILEGWVWHAALDRRTCAFCWSQHGSLHKLDEVMATHPRCRCTIAPRTVGWEAILGEKGKGIPDSRPKIEKGRDLFEQLSDERKRDILGPAKFAAYQEGKLKLADVAGSRKDPKWVPVGYERSLRDILGEEEAKKWLRLFRQRLAEHEPGFERRVRDLEMDVARRAVEVMHVVDDRGTVLFTATGDKQGIDLTEDQVAACKGKIVIHNHPTGKAFSTKDLRFLLDSRAKELRAIGTDHLYVLRPRPDEDWDWEDARVLVDTVMAQVRREMRDYIYRGIMTPEEADLNFRHQVWKDFAEIRGWEYRREPWPRPTA